MERKHESWQEQYASLMPTIERQLSFAFRQLRGEARDEAIQECRCLAAKACNQLYTQGKASVIFAAPIARQAVRHYLAGRRFAAMLNANDISSAYCQRRRGLAVKSLDQRDTTGDWKETIIADDRANPADVACLCVDFEEWLDQLDSRHRLVAELLASGERTCDVADRLGVTRGRISQMRRELDDTWAHFQGEA
jgi:hypothetical protein